MSAPALLLPRPPQPVQPARAPRRSELQAWPVPVSEPQPAVSAPGGTTTVDRTGPTRPLRSPADRQDVLPLITPRTRAVARLPLPRALGWPEDGPRPTPSDELPDPAALVRTVVATTLEVLTGCRPVSQLLRFTTPEVHTALSERATAAARRRRPGTPVQRTSVVRVSTCEPRDGVVEAAAVVTVGPRVRAVALRLEGWDGRWRVTVLELG